MTRDMKPSERIREITFAIVGPPPHGGGDWEEAEVKAIIAYLDERHEATGGEPGRCRVDGDGDCFVHGDDDPRCSLNDRALVPPSPAPECPDATRRPVDKALLREAAERCRDAAPGSKQLAAYRHLRNCFGWETVLNLLAELDAYDEQSLYMVDARLTMKEKDFVDAIARAEHERDALRTERDSLKAELASKPSQLAGMVDAMQENDRLRAELRKRDAVVEAAKRFLDTEKGTDAEDGAENAIEQALADLGALFALQATAVDPAQPVAERPILVGAKWQSAKHRAEVVDASGDVVDFWHTHHDGSRSRYCYPKALWSRDFTHISDPAAASEPETVGGESDE